MYVRLSTEGQIVLKYCHISKTLERGSINPILPPSTPCTCTTMGV